MKRLLALSLFAIASGQAAELVVRDLRLGLAMRPVGFDYTFTAPTVDDSGSDAFDAGMGFEVGGRWSFARPGDALGLIVGVDGLLDGLSYGGGDGLATTWGRLCIGPAWAVADRWTIAAEVGYQYGISAISLPETAGAEAFEASGTASGYDLRLTATWLMSSTFGVGVNAGWLMATYELSDDAVDLSVEQANWFAGVEVVWRFTDAPPRLE